MERYVVSFLIIYNTTNGNTHSANIVGDIFAQDIEKAYEVAREMYRKQIESKLLAPENDMNISRINDVGVLIYNIYSREMRHLVVVASEDGNGVIHSGPL